MSKKLLRFSDGSIAVVTNCQIHVLGAELVETLDAESLTKQEQSIAVAHPELFDLKTSKGKVTGLSRRPQEKPSKDEPGKPRMGIKEPTDK